MPAAISMTIAASKQQSHTKLLRMRLTVRDRTRRRPKAIAADRGGPDVAGPVDVCAPDRAVCAGGKVAVNGRVFLGLQFARTGSSRSQGRKQSPWPAQPTSRGCW